MQVKPFQRLGVSIFADGPHDPLNQFLTIGLHPLCLALCLLIIYHIHPNLFSYFSIIHQ
jgi:hypothetical protein